MRTAIKYGVAALCLFAFGMGCNSAPGEREEKMALKYGHTVAIYEMGTTPEVVKAPFDGIYYLYPTNAEGKPLTKLATMTANLKPGDSIGFQESEHSDAAVVAVAGNKTRSVPNQTYHWLYKQR